MKKLLKTNITKQDTIVAYDSCGSFTCYCSCEYCSCEVENTTQKQSRSASSAATKQQGTRAGYIATKQSQ